MILALPRQAEVLGWVGGRWWEPAALHCVFYATRVGRRLDRAGYVRFRPTTAAPGGYRRAGDALPQLP